MTRALKKANREIRKFLARNRDVYISHPCLTADVVVHYRVDGIHLSEVGNDIFLHDLQ